MIKLLIITLAVPQALPCNLHTIPSWQQRVPDMKTPLRENPKDKSKAAEVSVVYHAYACITGT